MKKVSNRWIKKFIKGCLNKKAYRTAEHAKEIAKKAEKERGVKLYYYWCKECGMFHLTKKPPRTEYDFKNRVF